MRKIEKEMIEVITNLPKAYPTNGLLYKKDNTEVYLDISYYDCTNILVFLHGHEIAVINITDKILTLNDKGYQTKTTKSRLNAILSHYNLPTIYSKNYQWFIGDEEWNGSKTFELEPPQKEFITVMKARIS